MILREDLQALTGVAQERLEADDRSRVRWTWWYSALFLAAGAGALWWHAASYLPFFSDDGFISLRYSQRWVQGEGLTWTAGERVEGYSNLLWVLLCAVPGALGFPWVDGARFVGVASIVLAMGAVLLAARPRRWLDGISALAGTALLASSASVAVWAIGGLEAPLVAGLVAWGVVLGERALNAQGPTGRMSRDLWWSAACFGLLCWCRPDGFLWGTGVVLGALVGWRRLAFRYSLAVCGALLLFVGAQLAFRMAYYDDPLPNTAYAKVALGEQRLALGWRYWVDSLIPLAATWSAFVLAGLTAVFDRSLRALTCLVFAPALVWTTYVIGVGGDIFPAWRHWVPLTALAAVAVTWVLRRGRASERDGDSLVSRSSEWRWAITLALLAFVGGSNDPRNWARAERWEWDGRTVGRILKEAFGGQQPLLAVDAAGALPFFSELPALDMLGLNDRFLAHNRPKNFGKGPVGHELGNADYYLARKPDIVCFAVPPCSFSAKYPEQRKFAASSEFRQGYAPARLVAGRGKRALVSELWVAKNGRVGIQRDGNRVRIPAYLFSGRSDAVQAELGGGTVVTRWMAQKKSSLWGIELASGRWQVSVPGHEGAATLRVKQERVLVAEGAAKDVLTVDVPEGGVWTIEVQAGVRGFAAREILLERR